MGAILREGGEAGSLLATGWFQPGSIQLPVVYTSNGSVVPRKDFNGNGGGYFFGTASNQGWEGAKELDRTAREVWVRVCVAVASVGSTFEPYHFALDDSTGTNQVNLYQPQTFTYVRARRNITVLGTSAPGVLPASPNWVAMNARVYIDDVNGEIEIFKDYNFASPVLSVTGVDTQNTADNFVQFFRIVADGSFYDDVAVNDATVVFDTTVGTLTPGTTITGNNTGTTAIVTSIVSGSGSGQGIAQLHFVRVNGTDPWNDPTTDPWATDTLLTGGGWTGQILAPKTTFRDANSGPMGDGYIFGATLSGDVAGDTQLVRAGIDTGNNYSQVGVIPADDATALQSSVETTTPGNRDMYEVVNTSTLGFSPGHINAVQSVTVSAVWQRDGAGLNNGNLVVEDSGVEYDGPSYPLAVSPAGDARILNVVPDGTVSGTDWTEAKVNSLRIGIKFTG